MKCIAVKITDQSDDKHWNITYWECRQDTWPASLFILNAYNLSDTWKSNVHLATFIWTYLIMKNIFVDYRVMSIIWRE